MLALSMVAAINLLNVWTFRTDAEINDIALNDKVMVVGTYQAAFGVDLATGKAIWTKAFAPTQFGSRVSIADSVALVSISNGPLLAIDLTTGRPLWNISRKGLASPISTSGSVAVSELQSGTVSAFDLKSRKPLWNCKLSQGPLTCLPVITSDAVYLADEAGEVIAMGWNGKELWRSNAGDSPISGLAIDDERVYATSSRGGVSALGKTTGSFIWLYDVSNAIAGPPIFKDGRLTVTSSGGFAICLAGLIGRPLWRKQLTQGQDFGISGPAFAGDQVMLMQRNRMVGLNEKGEIAWEARSDESASAKAPIKLKTDYLLTASHAVYRVKVQSR